VAAEQFYLREANQWMIPATDEILIWTRRMEAITIAGKSILK
jgi:hypothetical protein